MSEPAELTPEQRAANYRRIIQENTIAQSKHVVQKTEEPDESTENAAHGVE